MTRMARSQHKKTQQLHLYGRRSVTLLAPTHRQADVHGSVARTLLRALGINAIEGSGALRGVFIECCCKRLYYDATTALFREERFEGGPQKLRDILRCC